MITKLLLSLTIDSYYCTITVRVVILYDVNDNDPSYNYVKSSSEIILPCTNKKYKRNVRTALFAVAAVVVVVCFGRRRNVKVKHFLVIKRNASTAHNYVIFPFDHQKGKFPSELKNK